MTPNDKVDPSENENNEVRRRLISWPLSLIGLSLLLMLAANSVSAWGRGGGLFADGYDEADIGEIKQHVEYRIGRMLEKVEASEAQEAAIQAIVSDAIGELHTLHDGFASQRGEIRGLLTAETIDREAIEAIRASHLAQADSISRVVSGRLADVMEILTPVQRLALEQRFARHGPHHGRGHWPRGPAWR